MIKKNYDFNLLAADIIFVVVVSSIIGVTFYHSIYPSGYKECETRAVATNSSFSYNTFDGCRIFKEGQVL